MDVHFYRSGLLISPWFNIWYSHWVLMLSGRELLLPQCFVDIGLTIVVQMIASSKLHLSYFQHVLMLNKLNIHLSFCRYNETGSYLCSFLLFLLFPFAFRNYWCRKLWIIDDSFVLKELLHTCNEYRSSNFVALPYTANWFESWWGYFDENRLILEIIS